MSIFWILIGWTYVTHYHFWHIKTIFFNGLNIHLSIYIPHHILCLPGGRAHTPRNHFWHTITISYKFDIHFLWQSILKIIIKPSSFNRGYVNCKNKLLTKLFCLSLAWNILRRIVFFPQSALLSKQTQLLLPYFK